MALRKWILASQHLCLSQSATREPCMCTCVCVCVCVVGGRVRGEWGDAGLCDRVSLCINCLNWSAATSLWETLWYDNGSLLSTGEACFVCACVYVCVFVCTCADGNLVACTCQHATVSCRHQHSQGDRQSQTNRFREREGTAMLIGFGKRWWEGWKLRAWKWQRVSVLHAAYRWSTNERKTF